MLYKINKNAATSRDTQYSSATLYKVADGREIEVKALPSNTLFKAIKTTRRSYVGEISLLDTICPEFATAEYMVSINRISDGCTSWVESKLLIPAILLKRA